MLLNFRKASRPLNQTWNYIQLYNYFTKQAHTTPS